MKISKNKEESAMLAEIAVKGMQEKKAKDIVCLDLRKVHNAVSDFFIICHGDSNTQVDAIAGSVEHEIKKALGEGPWHREGFENAEWILLDYVNVVVHVFQKEHRDFYRLEALWADAETKAISS
ncbi:MAG: ribosome silencing factor [Bacteroidota bacterium]|nr:ribosome silencing factor [Bacteroidota bacterium]